MREGKRMLLPLSDLMFLLECEKKAHALAKVGYAGANVTADELLRALNEKASVPVDAVEAALFSFEQLAEAGKAEHPAGLTKVQWARKLCPPGLTFDDELGIYYTKR
jgi:hypothetical protein